MAVAVVLRLVVGLEGLSRHLLRPGGRCGPCTPLLLFFFVFFTIYFYVRPFSLPSYALNLLEKVMKCFENTVFRNFKHRLPGLIIKVLVKRFFKGTGFKDPTCYLLRL